MKTKGKWWKMYFWLLVALSILELGSNLLSEDFFQDNNYFGMLVGVVSLLGLYGYIQQTPILSKYFWAGIFISNILVLGYAVYNINRNWSKITEAVATDVVLWGYAIGFVFTIPLLFSLFSYAFNSSQLWSNVAVKTK
jgi:hypothetical protein